MKNNLNYRFLSFILLFVVPVFWTGCSDSEVDEPDVTELPDDPETQVKDFIWKAMNSWYLYDEEVGDLEDGVNKKVSGYAKFLASFSSPEALFDHLLYKKDNKDRFSFMADDYRDLENMLQGISESFGYDFQLLLLSENSDEIIGYVRYVLPGSPADDAGIQRGDLFDRINGKKLTTRNYQELLFNQKSYELGLVTLSEEGFEAGEEVAMEAVILHENPILVSEILEAAGGRNVGYLMLNGFNHTYHKELNEVFGNFESAGVKDLVLDLRYNPGGSILTAAILASMIYSKDPEKLFVKYDYNDKHQDMVQPLEFMDQVILLNGDFEITGVEPLHSLELPRVYVLTTSGTASASEAIINGLRPYMDVIVIGERTVGKNVGSRTLYDDPASDFTDKSKANPVHKYALQPLVTKIVNSDDFGEYEDGFAPDVKISELDYVGDLKPLGDPEEPLLHAALEMISPTRSGGLVMPANTGEYRFLPGPERKSQNPFYRTMDVTLP